MCGIGGFSVGKANLSLERKSMLCAILALGNESRGQAAHGFYVPGKNFKSLGGLSQAAIKMVKEPILMMHSRLPTTGSNTVENAHPFEIGSICGAHNGMIMNHSELNRRYDRNHAVDSMHIFSNLNEGKGLDDLYGYGAIEWVSLDKPDVINLCKLSGGELAIYGIGEGPDKVRGIVWSSDEDHVLQALQTIGVQYFAYEVKAGQIYSVQDGQLFYSEFNGMKTLSLGEKANYYMDPNSWRNGMQDYTPKGESVQTSDDIDAELMKEYLEGIGESMSEDADDGVLSKWRNEKSELKRMLGPEGLTMSEIDSEEEYLDGRGWVRVDKMGKIKGSRVVMKLRYEKFELANVLVDVETDEIVAKAALRTDAAEIVRRVNAHEALVEAVKALSTSEIPGSEAFEKARAALKLAGES